MDEYAGLFRFLNLPAAALKTALGTLHFSGTDEEFYNYGIFLPAMLPLWSTEDPSYVGYWKHWFSPRRITIVEAYIEENILPREIARNFNQLARIMAQYVINSEGDISDETQRFATCTGISTPELQQIGQIAGVTHEEQALLVLPLFAQDPPLACFEGGRGYPGDFPQEGMALTPQSVRGVCTYEVSEARQRQIAALPFAPPWFLADDQAPVFDALLRQGDYAEAWLSLNSTGWKTADAKAALRRLAGESGEPGLDLLAEAWSAQPHMDGVPHAY